MRILKDFTIPNLKIPKFKMPGILNIEELKVENETKEKNDKKIETSRYDTIQEVFNASTTKYKDNVCILEKFDHKGKFKEITYSEFREDVLGFGTGLISLLGLKGKRVAIIGQNTYNWYVSYMALLSSGIIVVPIDKELPTNEIENVIKRSKASAIIYSSRKKEAIEQIRANLPEVSYFIEMYSENDLKEKDVGFNYVTNIGKNLYKNGDDSVLTTKIDPDEFKLLIFTSGTTSEAKGVMISNRNLTENIYGALSYVRMYQTDRFFSLLPLHHTYESTIGFLIPLYGGSSIAICEGLKSIVQNLKETKPTIMLAVPLLIETLYKKINEGIKKSKKEAIVNSMIHVTNALKSVSIDIKRKVFSEIYDNLGGNIRIIVSAAAPIEPKVGKWLEDIGILFLQGYGLTETAPIAALTPESKPKVGSIGKPVQCAEIKIFNPNEKGEGEILIKSKTLMLGYYENEAATNEAVVDGWFQSGDIGYIDNEGYIYLTGRSKNIIVTQNGKNVYPEELESMISRIPYIKDCMVYGKVGEEKDDLKIAVKVTLDEDYIAANHDPVPSKEETYKIVWTAIKEINRKLTSYKAIKVLEIKDDEFEKTTTLKIKRFVELKKDEEKKKSRSKDK